MLGDGQPTCPAHAGTRQTGGGSGGTRRDPQKCFFEYASSLMAVFQGDVLQNGTLGVRGPFTHGVELTVELCSWFVNLEPSAIR